MMRVIQTLSDLARGMFLLVASFWVSGGLGQSGVLPPVEERFAVPAMSEQPDFQRHVLPLISRMGCNARDCHGSFQGRGDFRLSLFGYDFTADHQALTRIQGDKTDARIDTIHPKNSLLLKKPTREVKHEGGKLLRVGSWQYHVLLEWIRNGGLGLETPSRLDRLVVEPEEILFSGENETAQLRVVAVWGDGSREDVTGLSRFQSNDPSIASIDDSGLVQSGGQGDTHLVVFYDNGVRTIPVLRPVSDLVERSIQFLSSDTLIDKAIRDKLRKLGIQPSGICSDAEFLRRVSIDLTGTLPAPEEVETFLADPSENKRKDKIEELLNRPSHAAWWATKLCDFTGNDPFSQAELGQEYSTQWFRWMYRKVLDNLPYDQLVSGIVLATGRAPDESFETYSKEMSFYFRKESPKDFGDRDTMPHYWTRRSVEKPEDKALSFAHSFLGLRLQCAQCHKHPFDQWTQEDFNAFTEFFEPVRYGIAPESMLAFQGMTRQEEESSMMMMSKKDLGRMTSDRLVRAEEGETVPFRELYVATSTSDKEKMPRTLSLLQSKSVQLSPDEDPREHLMRWMRDPANPYFAKAFVNRVWANYFHRGIVDPPDDFNAANPPSNQALLDNLALAFIESGYDMKWLHREITSSQAYQRSWKPSPNNEDDFRHFSRAIPRRIPAEVVYDALKQVFAAESELDSVRADLDRRAVGHLSMRMSGTYAMNIFGKPARTSNCDCERSADTSMLQSIFFMNDPLVSQRLRESGWIKQTVEQSSRLDAADITSRFPVWIRESFLRVLGRAPTDEDMDRVRVHLSEAESVEQGLRDLFWALLNTKEFVLNH